MSRRYTRIDPTVHPVMVRLVTEHRLSYEQVANLFGCSRSRVVQIVKEQRDASD